MALDSTAHETIQQLITATTKKAEAELAVKALLTELKTDILKLKASDEELGKTVDGMSSELHDAYLRLLSSMSVMLEKLNTILTFMTQCTIARVTDAEQVLWEQRFHSTPPVEVNVGTRIDGDVKSGRDTIIEEE